MVIKLFDTAKLSFFFTPAVSAPVVQFWKTNTLCKVIIIERPSVLRCDVIMCAKYMLYFKIVYIKMIIKTFVMNITFISSSEAKKCIFYLWES